MPRFEFDHHVVEVPLGALEHAIQELVARRQVLNLPVDRLGIDRRQLVLGPHPVEHVAVRRARVSGLPEFGFVDHLGIVRAA